MCYRCFCRMKEQKKKLHEARINALIGPEKEEDKAPT
jgi:hypothetical protein